MNLELALGLDLGGTKIAAGVVDSRGKLISSLRIATPANGVKHDVAALFDAAHTAVKAAKMAWKSIRAVGVGVPGAVDPRTETVWAPNLPGWSKVRLRYLLGNALERPVFVESDRNVQALAEAWLGQEATRRARDIVFLTVGTGIGAGLISEGRLIPGAHGVAGAAGWMVIDRKWKPEYGRVGCLEALGAGPAVARLGKAAWQRDRRGKAPIQDLGFQIRDLKSEREVSAEVVAVAARRGDKAARRVLEEVGTNLGLGVANIVCLLNPEVVVLGGGLAGIGSPLLAPLRRALRQWGQPLARKQVRIVISRLGEQAGILGAARYALLKTEEKG